MERLIAFLGIFVLYGIAYGLSLNRSAINWKLVGAGLVLQLAIGVLIMLSGGVVMEAVAGKVDEFLALANAGSELVFGTLTGPEHFIIGIQILTTIVFFSSFISILYFFGVIQVIISVLAKLMRTVLGTSGGETLAVAANIFVGQTEGPLLVRPYLERMTKSELMAVMTGGFATIAGSVLGVYVALGIPVEHLITASLMSAPGALVAAKIMIPETEHSETAGDTELPKIDVGENVIEAAARGTTDGLHLALNVLAMLIAFTSLMAAANWILGGLDSMIDNQLLGYEETKPGAGGGEEYVGLFPGSLQTLFGTLFSPLAFLMGVSWDQAAAVGNLLGQKICVNEFVAYTSLTQMAKAEEIDGRSLAIASYALCGFANFASIGIQIGGIGALAPGRRTDLAKMGLRAMAGGAIASFVTACIAGILYPG